MTLYIANKSHCDVKLVKNPGYFSLRFALIWILKNAVHICYKTRYSKKCSTIYRKMSSAFLVRLALNVFSCENFDIVPLDI